MKTFAQVRMPGKYVLPTLVWLALTGTGWGQTERKVLDSLYRQLPKATHDTTRINLYIEIGKYYKGSEPDSALHFLLKARKLAEALPYPDGQIRALAHQADVWNRQHQFDHSLPLNRQALAIARRYGLKRQEANSYTNLAVTYQQKNQYDTCLRYYMQALPIYEELHNNSGLWHLYINLCGLYTTTTFRNYTKALAYSDKALALVQKYGNAYDKAVLYLNRGAALTGLRRYPQALAAFREAEQQAKSIQNILLQQAALLNISGLPLNKKEHKRLIPTLTQMLALSEKTGEVKIRAMALRGLALSYLHTRDFRKARTCIQESIGLCRKYKLLEVWEASAALGSDVELALGNMDAYYILWRESDSVRTAFMDAQARRNIQELETQYEASRKEGQIKQLQKEKQIQVLNLKQKNMINYVFAGTIASLLTVGFLFYRTTRHQKIITRQTGLLQQQRIRELEQSQQLLAANSMLQGQEAERRRLAKDLHDGLGGMLSGVKLFLSDMKGNLILSEQNASRFSMALDQLDGTIRELRRVAHSMMPESLVRFGLTQALQDFCYELGRAAQLEINLQVVGLEARMDSDIEIAVYRIVQELLNNAVKHAGASSVLVQIARTDDTLTLTVEDNGCGFDPTQAAEGIGLANIRSRVEYLGGTLDIQAAPGTGTAVNIDFLLSS